MRRRSLPVRWGAAGAGGSGSRAVEGGRIGSVAFAMRRHTGHRNSPWEGHRGRGRERDIEVGGGEGTHRQGGRAIQR